jgi:hypothetical protein
MNPYNKSPVASSELVKNDAHTKKRILDDEKQDATSLGDVTSGETTDVDIHAPFAADPRLPIEKNPFTLRAVLIGWCLGALVNAINVYLGTYTYVPSRAGQTSASRPFL